MKPKVISAKVRNLDRYVIIDELTGDILDNAQGFGYKNETSANKVMWFKYQGGLEITKEQKISANDFFKKHPEIHQFILDYYDENFASSMRGIFSYPQIIQEVKKAYNVVIPKYYLKYL